jgi:hypothetical protein
MNMAEGARLRALESQVEALTNQIKDVVRRLDDLSNAERARSEREARKKVG